MVRLKFRYRVCYVPWFRYFNSLMVRLKFLWLMASAGGFKDFNSLMVRLKFVGYNAGNRIFKFQFLNGAIKISRSAGEGLHRFHFNSLMVRLKFPFLTFLKREQQNFNSLMVRLKCILSTFYQYANYISIP